MLKRDYISWWLRPSFLRQWGKRKQILFAGPWVGEFGWELMSWQGFVRKLSHHYAKTIISCRPGNQALYEDFADEFIPHQIRGVSECNVAHRIENPEELQRIAQSVPQEADWLKPLGFQPAKRQEFIRYGNPEKGVVTDCLFHPRGRQFGDDRNWDVENWNRLLRELNSRQLKVGCIGLKKDTLKVNGDLRDIPLSETLNHIAATDLVIGPSSGPMHLASLCKTPHLVWTDNLKYMRGHPNRYKYETLWNPLRSPVEIIDDYQFKPPVDIVVQKMESFQQRLHKNRRMEKN